jgi:hypothetical protein
MTNYHERNKVICIVHTWIVKEMFRTEYGGKVGVMSAKEAEDRPAAQGTGSLLCCKHGVLYIL